MQKQIGLGGLGRGGGGAGEGWGGARCGAVIAVGIEHLRFLDGKSAMKSIMGDRWPSRLAHLAPALATLRAPSRSFLIYL